jgi:hypothetical protein
MQLRENALWPYVAVGMLGGIRTEAIPALGHPRSHPGTRAEHEGSSWAAKIVTDRMMRLMNSRNRGD